eukprot:scaffold1332_cov166-Amphora_coffeaeformis.AAC.4
MDNVRRRQGASTTNDSSPVKVSTTSNGSAAKENGGDSKDKVEIKGAAHTPLWVYVLLVVFAIVSFVTYPVPFQPHGEPTLRHVFFYGWMTAISTGCGVLPFLVLPEVPKFWVGISNGKEWEWGNSRKENK